MISGDKFTGFSSLTTQEHQGFLYHTTSISLHLITALILSISLHNPNALFCNPAYITVLEVSFPNFTSALLQALFTLFPNPSKGLWVTALSSTSFLLPNRAEGYIKHLCFWLAGIWIWPTVASTSMLDLQLKLYFKSIACVLYRFLCWAYLIWIGCLWTSATLELSGGFSSLDLWGQMLYFYRQRHT